ncbi:Centrosomal protein of 41 kDa [Microtus ochrogaster]|uniref:Centrosomal protein of 41 kDa n=1 Tax=Microtus ochrogaster TaxID=79684 RepID=A0A8J6FZB9_MICOH|nr:Centrosomal protein of 41 kDa [Microtus ochrogaster]
MSNALSLSSGKSQTRGEDLTVEDGMGFHILQARRIVSLSASGSFTVDKSFAKEKLRKSTLGSYLPELVTLGGTVLTHATRDLVQEMKYLTRRIPQNPRYQHIKSRLDTGNSMTKYIEKLEEIKKNYRYKKDELFKRLKVTTFAQLPSFKLPVLLLITGMASLLGQLFLKGLLRLALTHFSGLFRSVVLKPFGRPPAFSASPACAQPHAVHCLFVQYNDSTTSEADAEIAAKTNGKGSPGEQSPSPVQFINSTGAGDSSRSTLQSVISGVGELDVDKGLVKKEEPSGKDMPYPDCPFLLLDVRDRDSYQQCHIVGGKKKGSGAPQSQEQGLASFQRKWDASTAVRETLGIIIMYDDDERLASQAATTMCERGFENLFMLSGGLKVLAQKFPEGLVTGSLPASCQQALPLGSARKRSSPKMPPLPAENKWRFTPEDLKKIECYLEADQGLTGNHSRMNQNNSAGRDLKVPAGRSGQNLPTGGPASHSNPRTLNSGHLQGKPWK